MTEILRSLVDAVVFLLPTVSEQYKITVKLVNIYDILRLQNRRTLLLRAGRFALQLSKPFDLYFTSPTRPQPGNSQKCRREEKNTSGFAFFLFLEK